MGIYYLLHICTMLDVGQTAVNKIPTDPGLRELSVM